MNQFEMVNIIWLFGALLLAGSALAGYRLSWRKSAVYVLLWGAIFTAVTLVINLVNNY